MNKNELVNRVAKETKTPISTVRPIITSLLEQIALTILTGERVNLNALGSFELRDKKQRAGFDPTRKIPISIPGGKKIKFKPSPSFESKVKELYSTKTEQEAVPIYEEV